MKGFTLIELLVVIAIIGILSSVVLASLNTARSKGNDASVKANLDTIRTQSAIYYDTNNGYGNGSVTAATATAVGCYQANSLFVDPNIQAAIVAADKAAGGTGAIVSPGPTKTLCSVGVGTASVPSATWAVYTVTANNSNGNLGWCVDSTGASKASTALTGAACP